MAILRRLLLAVVSSVIATSCAGPVLQPPTTPAGTATPATDPTTGPSLLALAPINPTEAAVVVFVIDGDTIRVEKVGDEFNEYAVRYIGIDAPERQSEPLWQEATEANAAFIAGREVYLERDTSDTDRYGRLLRHVWLPTDDGWLNIGAEIVRLGLAEARTYRPDVLWDARYAAVEAEARAAERGIWRTE